MQRSQKRSQKRSPKRYPKRSQKRSPYLNATKQQFNIDLQQAEADLILKNPEYVKLYDLYRRSGHISIQNFLANIGYYGWKFLKLRFALGLFCYVFGSNI
jgi:hypothetical protein